MMIDARDGVSRAIPDTSKDAQQYTEVEEEERCQRMYEQFADDVLVSFSDQ